MFNEAQVTIMGWVGGAVTLREVSGGRHVATFRLASTPRTMRQGQWVNGPTTWFTVTAWNRLARNVADTVRSGEPVVVHGVFTADVWTREDGVSVTSHTVLARAVGHDLSYGTSAWTRSEPEGETTSDAA